jgi:hypothetical protein
MYAVSDTKAKSSIGAPHMYAWRLIGEHGISTMSTASLLRVSSQYVNFAWYRIGTALIECQSLAWRSLSAKVKETHFDLTRNNVFCKPLELLEFVVTDL